MQEEDDQTRRKRLLYQAQHRGFKEADLLIGGFAAAHLVEMSAADLDEFEVLLAQPDHDLFAWVTGDKAPPSDFSGPIFQKMCDFDVSTLTAPNGRLRC